MPSFLFRYIFRDLLKVLAISSVVLVTVISFGAAIKPLGDGELGPFALMRYILLAMPPMLQFALPFAAAFSATIVYHRMAQDREIAACATNGMPYHRMLMPAVVLGLVLSVGLLGLAHFISPFFWESMERTARLDAPEYLARAVERGEPVRAGNTLIRVNRVIEIDPAMLDELAGVSESGAAAVTGEPGGPAAKSAGHRDTVLFLQGVIVAVRERGEIVSDAAAAEGVFRLTRLEDRTIITSLLRDAVIFNHDSDTLMWTPEPRLGEHVLEDSFRASPRFMNLTRLREVDDHPEMFWRVREKVDLLRAWVAQRIVRETLSRSLSESGRVVLTTQDVSTLPAGILGPEDAAPIVPGLGEGIDGARGGRGGATKREYVLHAGTLTPMGFEDEARTQIAWLIEPAAGATSVRLVQRVEGQPTQEIVADRVIVRPRMSALGLEPRLDLELQNAESQDLRIASEVRTRQEVIYLSSLGLRQADVSDIESWDAQQLIHHPYAVNAPNEVRLLMTAVDREVRELRNGVLSRLHERAALSLSVLVMMLLGAVMAVRLQNALPLTVYFVAFVPAIIALLVTSAGADLVQNIDVSNRWALLVLWSGNMALLLITLVVYRSIARN